jgi:hypothetical protein
MKCLIKFIEMESDLTTSCFYAFIFNILHTACPFTHSEMSHITLIRGPDKSQEPIKSPPLWFFKVQKVFAGGFTDSDAHSRRNRLKRNTSTTFKIKNVQDTKNQKSDTI